jgi:glycosyltransferase involved in cell wall biosynthesis
MDHADANGKKAGTGGGLPFFSVVVPCCNVGTRLRGCLESLLAQPFRDWECLLAVEESEDATEAVAREFAAGDARFRVSTGPRTGSCSVPRNRGIEDARGEHVLFLDGDDLLVPGSLARIAAGIAGRPGADLYPCALRVRGDIAGTDGELRDNYPPGAPAEMTGPEATILSNRYRNDTPHPQMQLTVFRRAFLLENGLRCIPGLRRQDSEFSPRALYLARRVVPLHVCHYVYCTHPASVSASERGADTFLGDWAVTFRSLFAFHARVSREPGFDRRVAEGWRRLWLSRLFGYWFYPSRVRDLPRRRRAETLEILFRDGFSGLESLAAGASAPKRAACRWVERFVRHPALRPAAEAFFRVYFALAESRRR